MTFSEYGLMSDHGKEQAQGPGRMQVVRHRPLAEPSVVPGIIRCARRDPGYSSTRACEPHRRRRTHAMGGVRGSVVDQTGVAAASLRATCGRPPCSGPLHFKCTRRHGCLHLKCKRHRVSRTRPVVPRRNSSEILRIARLRARGTSRASREDESKPRGIFTVLGSLDLPTL